MNGCISVLLVPGGVFVPVASLFLLIAFLAFLSVLLFMLNVCVNVEKF